jgi:hypothetical protein
VYESNNTGVYKNFAVGNRVPSLTRFRAAAIETVGTDTVLVWDPASTRALFPNENYYLVVGSISSSVGFYEVIPRRLYETADAALAAVVSTQQWDSNPYSYRMAVSGELVGINPDYPGSTQVPFVSIDDSSANVYDYHYGSLSADFPLIDVREVDADYQFTGNYYACGTGDGLVVIDNPTLNQRLVLDSRNPEQPRHDLLILNTQTQSCEDVFSGQFQ